MKKLLLSTMALTLALSITACGGKETPDAVFTPEPTIVGSIEGEPITTQAPAPTDAPAQPEEPQATAPAQNEVSGETVGQTLLAAFEALMADEAAAHDALSLADRLVANEIIPFDGDSVEMEAGFFPGFANYEISGFEQAATFGPIIGSIPFVGYVFVLPEDADTDAFMTGLKENANLRWNICVEAEEMVCEANGNTVFFLMCPTQFEQ